MKLAFIFCKLLSISCAITQISAKMNVESVSTVFLLYRLHIGKQFHCFLSLNIVRTKEVQIVYRLFLFELPNF